MKSLMLSLFACVMIVSLATATTGKKCIDEEDYKTIMELLEGFTKLDKRGTICSDPFMDGMAFTSSMFCRRRRRDVRTALGQ